MQENYIELEDSEKFSKIISSERLVVVDFYAEWCMPCLMLSPILEDLAEHMKSIKFIRINIDDNEELAKQYNVKSVPCLIFFKDGKEINKIIGSHSSDIIEEKIKVCLGC